MHLICHIAIGLLLAAGLDEGASAAVAGAAGQQSAKVLTIAHRGASGYAPENTMAAFEKALELDADYIELDVQLSRDGRLMLIHDTTVNRTTNGTGLVGSMTYDELKTLDAGSFFSPAFAGEPIPSLDEALDRYHNRIGILIEIKSPHLYPGIEEKIAQALRVRGLHQSNDQKIIVQSFDFQSLKKFHSLLPEVPIGVLTAGSYHLTEEMLAEFSAYADYINPNLLFVNEDVVQRIHAHGMGIMTWTVRDAAQVRPLLKLNVEGIITDYPDYVIRERS
ncbi:glycerophosphodiester phosphodiesterase [Paenibacillus oenotherae]|uniref:Glycerophosphodiester phosphodiesterase n=1 Tax=Paenibacillus oenotherae TaxID=1435645 RepID=A0ABS7CZW4_9BACL|nr:glycerophosphodiester phosphodiesterase family protein [Paenibacillus oenotherae]MBW7473165.1 glycerophosphodiester phosphodiesterase [Paenibacillus oenotherae]